MNKRSHEYFAVIAAILLAAVLASGCSTPAQTNNLNSNDSPPVSYVTPGYANNGTSSYGSGNSGAYNIPSTQTPAQSYYQCMNVLTQYGMQQQCYQVSSPNTNSYSQYTYSKVGFAKGISEEAKQSAYASYLSALDRSAAADMKAQYDALIAQYSK